MQRVFHQAKLPELILIIAIIAILAAILFPVFAQAGAETSPPAHGAIGHPLDLPDIPELARKPVLATANPIQPGVEPALGAAPATMGVVLVGLAKAPPAQGGGFADWIRSVIRWLWERLRGWFAGWKDAVLSFLRSLSISFRIETNSTEYCRASGFMVFRGPWRCEMWRNGSFNFRFGQ
jgi:hypothetical protein